MKATIYYVNSYTSGLQRSEASQGWLLPPQCLTRTIVREVPACFTPRDGGDRSLAICEALFRMHQSEQAPVTDINGEKVRSMSIGDVVAFDTQPNRLFVCGRDGFRMVDVSADSGFVKMLAESQAFAAG